MARHFREQDIDEFRDCFYLNTCSSGQISDVKELKTIMRSLGMSPTIPELELYMKGKGGKLSFADFLDVMHTHSKKEKVPSEILDAFTAWPNSRHGSIATADLRHILSRWGERLEDKELEKLFREANITTTTPFLNFNDLVRIIAAPAPDY